MDNEPKAHTEILGRISLSSFQPLLGLPIGYCFVGDGKDTYFLKDQPVGENSLCFLSPHLYHLSSSKSCKILNLLVGSENLSPFSVGFRHNLTHTEMVDVASLFSLIEGCSFRKRRRDAL